MVSLLQIKQKQFQTALFNCKELGETVYQTQK